MRITHKLAFMISTDMTASQGDIDVSFERKDTQSPKWLISDIFDIGREQGLDQLMYATHASTLLTLSATGPGSDHKSFLAKGIPERDGVGAHACVQVGGDGCWVAHMAQHVPAPLIGVKNDDVWSFWHGVHPLRASW